MGENVIESRRPYSIDYSQYINKTWIVDGWNELTDSEWDLEVSMIITRIEDR